MVPADAELETFVAFKAGVGMDYAYLLGDRAKGQSPPDAVKLVLNGAMPISVRLHDSLGKPVAHVKVAPWQLEKKGHSYGFCFRTTPVGAVSDAQGRVQFDWLPADLEKWVAFSVNDGDYNYPVQDQLFIKDGGSRNLDVEILRPAQVAGKVTYSDGRPAAGIMIEAEGMVMTGGRFYAITAEDGTYRLKVHPNNSYIVAVVNDQWAAASLMGIVVKEGENRDNLDLQLNKGTFIHGTISVDTDSWPSAKTDGGLSVQDLMHDPYLSQFGHEIPNEWRSLPGPHLWGDGPDQYRVRLERTADIDATGRYAFRVGPGEYQLHLPGFPPQTERLTVTNQREIIVDSAFPKLPPPLRGIVVDRAGKPVPLAFVVYLMGAPGSQIHLAADKDGRFTLQRYERTAGHVYVGSADANLAGLRAIAEDENDVTIVTDKAATVVGRVVDAAGRPLSGMSVVCDFFPPQMPQRSLQVWAETDKEGKYKLSALVPGWHGKMSYRLDAENLYELFKGPKIVVQSGENNLGDTIPQPVDQEPNDPSNKTSAKDRSPASHDES